MAAALAACDLSQSTPAPPADEPTVTKPAAVSWRDLSVPWTDTTALHFREASARISNRPLSVAQTLDSALFVSDSGSLRELALDERDAVLTTATRGIPIADASGHLAAWVEGSAEQREIVAYDTASHAELSRLHVDEQVFVMAVNGDTIVFFEDPYSYAWQPGSDAAPQRLQIRSHDERTSRSSCSTSLVSPCS